MNPLQEQRMVEQTIFSTPLIRLGRFDTQPDDPLFREPSPPGYHVVAFPEIELEIDFDRVGVSLIDPTIVTFYHPDEVYRRRPIHPDGDRCFWLAPSREVLEYTFGWDRGLKLGSEFVFGYPAMPLSRELFVMQRNLFNRIGVRAREPLEVEESVLALISRLATLFKRPPEPIPQRFTRKLRRPVERALRLIATGFRGSQTLAEIAQHCACSPYHLCRIFRAQTGFTLHGYRKALRLRHSYDSLSTRGGSVAQLAFDLGFSNQSQFSNLFKGEFSCTPSSVRAEGR